MTEVQNVILLCDNSWTVTDKILDILNDYLIEQYCNSKLKKPIKEKKELFDDAVSYVRREEPNFPPQLIKDTAIYLGRENKLILINPSDI